MCQDVYACNLTNWECQEIFGEAPALKIEREIEIEIPELYGDINTI